jgi:hypothetical protein
VRVIQRRDRARFAIEPLAQLRVGGELRRQHLDRDDPIEPGVARAIDLTHAARPKRRDNLIRPESNAGRHGHGAAGLYGPYTEKGGP